MIEKQPEIITYETGQNGPNFTVLGAVHGNEKCGPQAIERIREAIADGKIRLKKGTLTVVPICNPRAYDQDVRFTERNLNRFFYPKENPDTYEGHLHNIICPVAEKADYLLDLHSYTSPGEAFLILEDTKPDNLEFAAMTGVPRIISGHSNAIAHNDDAPEGQNISSTDYARQHGARALTLECGNHQHPRAADVGFQSVLNVLKALNMAEIDPEIEITDLPNPGEFVIEIIGVELKLRDGEFTGDWKNMDQAKEGEVIARYDDGEELTMPEDGFIVLPKKNADIGHEWFFWGMENKGVKL